MNLTIQAITQRIRSAEDRFGPFASTHEASGVALEEWRELQKAIHANDRSAIEHEACDLAAALIRLAEQLHAGNPTFLRRSGLIAER